MNRARRLAKNAGLEAKKKARQEPRKRERQQQMNGGQRSGGKKKRGGRRGKKNSQASSGRGGRGGGKRIDRAKEKELKESGQRKPEWIQVSEQIGIGWRNKA